MRCRYSAEQLEQIVNGQYYVAVRMFLDAIAAVIRNEIENQPPNFKVKIVLKVDNMPVYDVGGEFYASCFQLNPNATLIVDRALDYFMNFLTSNQSFDLFNKVTAIINAFPATPPPTLNAANGPTMQRTAGSRDNSNSTTSNQGDQTTLYNIKQAKRVNITLSYENLAHLDTVVDPSKLVERDSSLAQACLPSAITQMAFQRSLLHDRDLAICLLNAWNGAVSTDTTVCKPPYALGLNKLGATVERTAGYWSSVYWNGLVSVMDTLDVFKRTGDQSRAELFRKCIKHHRECIMVALKKCTDAKTLALQHGVGQLVLNQQMSSSADKKIKKSAEVVSKHYHEIESAICQAFSVAIENFRNNGLIKLAHTVKSRVTPTDAATGRYELRQAADILRAINDLRINAIQNYDQQASYQFYMPINGNDAFNQMVSVNSRHYLFDCTVTAHSELTNSPTQNYQIYNIAATPGTPYDESVPRETIFIVQHKNHVFGMPSFRSFMRSVNVRKYFCRLCNNPYTTGTSSDPTAHLCKFICNFCYRSDCGGANKKFEQLCGIDSGIICEDCHRWFPDPSVTRCYENHKLQQNIQRETISSNVKQITKYTICQKVRNCGECMGLVNLFRFGAEYKHKCGEVRCKHCRLQHAKGDYCYFVANEGSTRSKELRDNLPIYVDFETAFTLTADTQYNARVLAPFHAAVGMLLRQADKTELEQLNEQPFLKCVESSLVDEKVPEQKYLYATIRTFDGLDSNEKLVNWMLTSPLCNNRAIVAHNGNKFDFSFIQNELLRQGITPEIIYDGHNQMVRMKVLIRAAANQNKSVKHRRELHFIDSFKFMTQSLESIHKNLVPSAVSNSKTYFPYSALSVANATKGYLDDFPTKDTFGQKVQGNADFEQWYAAESVRYAGRRYEIVSMMKTYCDNDVKILAEAFTAFLVWIQNMSIALSPLVDVCTVAGMAQKTFLESHYHFGRTKIADKTLPMAERKKQGAELCKKWGDKKIAVISDTPGTNYSQKANKFFAFLNKFYGVAVYCNEFGGERKVECHGRPFSVDGYMELPASAAAAKVLELMSEFKMELTDVKDMLNDPEGVMVKIVLEFQGCYYHGCKLCKDPEADHYASGLKMSELRHRSDIRVKMISNKGYVVLEIRECLLKKVFGKTILGDKYRSFRVNAPYKHRDGLLGGRCENITRYYGACKCLGCTCAGCATETKTSTTTCVACNAKVLGLCYVDITSLYPWVLATCPFPIGAPVVLLNQTPDKLNDLFGFAQVDVVPPHNLFIPVLPVRDNDGRLVFGLCNECINTKNMSDCTHSEEQRTLSGIYFTEELKEAVKHGYIIKAIYQVYHWAQKSTDIFRPYIQHFFEQKMLCDDLSDELKALAPNLTGDAQTEAIKTSVREIGKQLCGLDLKLDKPFKKNSALRFIVKLLLNSLWGRFGMQTDGKKTEFFTEDEAEKVMQLMSNSNIEVTHYIICDGVNNTSTISIEYRTKAGATGDQANINIPIAAMTTAWARLRMYEIFSAVTNPADIMYYDTDSIIAVESALPQLSKYMEHSFMLGQLKSELKPGERIVDFWCCGPKSYQYTTNLNHQVQHYKGIPLCDEVRAALSNDVVGPIVETHEFGQQSGSVKVNQFQIVKTSIVPGNLQAREFKKILQSTADKKRKWEGTAAITYPFGYNIPH